MCCVLYFTDRGGLNTHSCEMAYIGKTVHDHNGLDHPNESNDFFELHKYIIFILSFNNAKYQVENQYLKPKQTNEFTVFVLTKLRIYYIFHNLFIILN